ncbi:rho-associated protein kinase 2 [Kryptolebias marmoratus]|uniref:rho-associated protein kinase 2 n=1 Tax=Kryptolebias marmoratus TaxID=37003 RepID=UPI0018AD0911|nr:rho-associated protein kinase 2 [Kryptolebias marmoratus]
MAPSPPPDMAGYEETDRNGEDADNLLYTDVNEDSSLLRWDSLPHKPDHCDLLFDAMDAQLEQLQMWSHSSSKGAGLGSTTQTSGTSMFCLDLMHASIVEIASEDTVGCWGGSVSHRETMKQIMDRSTSDTEEGESQREQVIWRLERLLGDAWKEGAIAETRPPSDSICTEDFVRCFREEMVDLSPSDSVEQLNKEDKADGDTDLSDQNGSSVDRRGSQTAETVMDHCSQSNRPPQRKCNCGVNVSPINEEARGRSNTLQKLGDYDEVFYRTDVVTNHENTIHSPSCSPEPRCLPDPVRSFDSLSTDSDSDTTTQAEIGDPQSAAVRSPSEGQNQDPSAQKTHRNRRKTCRLLRSLRDNEGTEEESSQDSLRRMSEMQSGWKKMKEQLLNLEKKCEEEEEKLKLKRMQVKDAELCLSELQQKNKHAMQRLEQLSAEQEKRTLESVLRDTRAEKESVSFQLQQLQRQRESRLPQVQNHEEPLTTLRRQKQTLKEGSCMKTSAAVISVLEFEEMERQLDCAKTELFTEQRRARERIDFLQEKLEETCEELHRASEAERSLRNRCAGLEKQIHRFEQQEVQVSEPRHEVGECRIGVGMPDAALAQKELQLSGLKEQCGSLLTERDDLKRELQHLKTQHCKELKEAQEQTHLLLWSKLEPNKEPRSYIRGLFDPLPASNKYLVKKLGTSLIIDAFVLCSFTLAEALPCLRAKREQLKFFISHLHQELESQKHINEQLKKEKEQELSIQRQQLEAEKDRALNSLRTRLIQEHIEELSRLKCVHKSGSGGAAASLRRQLQDKDLELRQLQGSMARWKQQTAARLACCFEEQLTAELERCKAKLIRSRKASKTQEVRPEREMTHGAKETQKAVSCHWLHTADSAAAHVPSDVASLKLLHYLQRKVKQLRGENQAFLWTPNPPQTVALNMSGSCLTEITQVEDGAEIQSQPR